MPNVGALRRTEDPCNLQQGVDIVNALLQYSLHALMSERAMHALERVADGGRGHFRVQSHD